MFLHSGFVPELFSAGALPGEAREFLQLFHTLRAALLPLLVPQARTGTAG
ncbi:hypothetical protein [Cupriavidus basilensis]|nr:hypothetical protein [Cupriavidus basilensis]MDF3887313.1 hypothetical protein [Cupriavidus basilensis]